jgi:hypothetical protein
MSANLNVTPGTGAVVAAESVGGALIQRVKMVLGDADADAGDVSLANPMVVLNKKDTGRNQTNYFMAAQVVSTASEALQSLTGYKSGAAVGATTTPAVVTSGKTYRINKIVITYVAIATAGAIQVNLRANLSGTVVVGSPLVDSWLVGGPAATAGVTTTAVIAIPEGIEFAAGTGIGITVLGVGPTGTAAITGYAKISVGGYEY